MTQIPADFYTELGITPLELIKIAQKKKAKTIVKPDWMQCLWKYAEHVSQYSEKWVAYNWLKFVSEKVQAAIEKGNARLILTAPPRHGKSKLISHWLPCWYIHNNPSEKVIISSYGDTLSTKWGRESRDEFINNPAITVLLKKDVLAAGEWETREGGGVFSTSIGGPITGRGSRLIIIDDPIKDWVTARSKVYRQLLRDWFRSTLYTRVEGDGNIIVIMTRWTEDDFCAFLMKEHSDNWQLINLPAIAEENDVLGRKTFRAPNGEMIGEALCPERISLTKLLGNNLDSGDGSIRRAVGESVWVGLFQQRPAPLEGNIFKRSWWKYWTVLPARFDRLFFSWDMAFKDNDDSSFVVGGLIGCLGADRYLIDLVRKRMNFTDTLQAVRSFSAKYPNVIEKLVENKANGPAIVNTLKSEIGGFIEWNPQGKLSQAQAVSPLVQAGNVFIPDVNFEGKYTIDNKEYLADNYWVHDFVSECADFPNAANDDQVDMLSNGLLRSQNVSGNEIGKIDYSLLDPEMLRQNPWQVIDQSEVDTGYGT